jgi:hypothetical protein
MPELILGPGMPCRRRCLCGAPLAADDGERCEECQPRLSPLAREVGAARRAVQDQVADLERRVSEIEIILRKLKKKVAYHARKDSTVDSKGYR